MAVNNSINDEALPTTLAADIEKQPPEEKWLIRPLWGRMAVGIIGGAPKCCKSWLALDMALSIASCTPCLGRFPVEHAGPALIYLAEDSTAMVRSRIDNICSHRNINIEHLPLHVITAPSLRLDLRQDQQRLMNTIENLQPNMLLLDPLIRLHRLDENSSSDVSGMLGYFRELQRTFNLAVILVHHSSKKYRKHPGQSLRGSSDLHAFGDSNAYLVRKNNVLSLTIEHRCAPAPDPFLLQLISKKDKNTHLEAISDICLPEQKSDSSLKDDVMKLLKQKNFALYRKDIRSRLRVNNQRLGQELNKLEAQALIIRTKDGWKLNKPTHLDSQNNSTQLQLSFSSNC